MLRNTTLVFSFVTALACGDSLAAEGLFSSSESNAPVVAVAAAVVANASETAPTAGAVTGEIKLKGEIPAAPPVDISSDPICAGLHADGMEMPTVRGADGGLADVFIQLTGVPDERYKAPDEAVVLDQVGCSYEPHVFGIVKKQDILIRNSDDTLHNIHPTPKVNREFNVGMPTKGMEITKTFKKPEEAIVFKCDVHIWMKAFCFVMEHPYFAVTDGSGDFSISTADLPDGEYGVTTWHETLGSKEGKVTVKDGKGTFDLTYEL
jgi:hypothetical protein